MILRHFKAIILETLNQDFLRMCESPVFIETAHIYHILCFVFFVRRLKFSTNLISHNKLISQMFPCCDYLPGSLFLITLMLQQALDRWLISSPAFLLSFVQTIKTMEKREREKISWR